MGNVEQQTGEKMRRKWLIECMSKSSCMCSLELYPVCVIVSYFISQSMLENILTGVAKTFGFHSMFWSCVPKSKPKTHQKFYNLPECASVRQDVARWTFDCSILQGHWSLENIPLSDGAHGLKANPVQSPKMCNCFPIIWGNGERQKPHTEELHRVTGHNKQDTPAYKNCKGCLTFTAPS